MTAPAPAPVPAPIPSPPAKKKGKGLKVAAGVIGVLLLFSMIAALSGDDTPDTSASNTDASDEGGGGATDPAASGGGDTIPPSSNPDPASEPQAEPETEPEPDPGFGNGIWRVGVDIEPGLYRAAASSGCYWARLSGFSGNFDEIEANEVGGYIMVVEILASDEGFESRSCARWIPLDEHLNATADQRPYTTVEDGFFVVGDEVQAGSWRTEGGSNCYWARLSGFTGHFGDIEANGLPDGPAIVEIQSGDVGFHAKGCGEWEYLG